MSFFLSANLPFVYRFLAVSDCLHQFWVLPNLTGFRVGHPQIKLDRKIKVRH